MSDVSKKEQIKPGDLQTDMFPPPNLGWAESGDVLALLLEFCQKDNLWSFNVLKFVNFVYQKVVWPQYGSQEPATDHVIMDVTGIYGTLMVAAQKGYLEHDEDPQGTGHGMAWRATNKLIESWVMHQPNTF